MRWRRFNRSFTRRIGVLSDSYLDTGRPLGPSRLLFELGAGATGVTDLRRRLGLDSGYLSRLLRQLEHEKLVAVEADPTDGRRRVVRLTARGQREWRRLDQRAERRARRLLDPLADRQRAQLAVALGTAERILAAAAVSFEIADPRSLRARDALRRYFAELAARFPAGFDADQAGAEDDVGLGPPEGTFLVISADGTTVGCGGLKHIDGAIGEIKRMWIDPDWRGLGLGARLLAELEAVARRLGRVRLVLDTNETLTEAIAMYLRAGYDAIERYNDNPYAQRWFAKKIGPNQVHPDGTI
jgi:DNA-binding MarR family transcriptional regulator/GNAT superfamily N-acetyltransferase